MKNKLIVLLSLLAVPSIAFAENGTYIWIYSNFRHWLYPISFYTLIFGALFMGLQVCLYLKHKAKVNNIIVRFCQYFKVRPTLAVIFCGITIGAVLGLCTRIAWSSRFWSRFLPYLAYMQFLEVLFYTVWITIALLLACGRFRNKVLLSPSFMKGVLSIIISVLCANLLYLILTEMGVLRLGQLPWGRDINIDIEREFYDLNSILWLWMVGLIYIVPMPISLLLLWIGNGYRYVKNSWQEKKDLERVFENI